VYKKLGSIDLHQSAIILKKLIPIFCMVLKIRDPDDFSGIINVATVPRKPLFYTILIEAHFFVVLSKHDGSSLLF